MSRSTMLLKGALEVLREKGWCQRDTAQDEEGQWADVLGEHACRFCPTGALEYVAHTRLNINGIKSAYELDLLLDEPIVFLRDAIKDLHDGSAKFQNSVVTFNDTYGRTKEEVFAIFERAIELSQERDSS